MQPLLFYSVSVNIGILYARFTLPSNLPFPSPLGTEVFLACDDSHLARGFRGAEVSGYEHRENYDHETRRSSLGELLMHLMPPDDDRYVEPSSPYYIKPECYEEFREMMEEFGWTVHDESPELWRKEEE